MMWAGRSGSFNTRHSGLVMVVGVGVAVVVYLFLMRIFLNMRCIRELESDCCLGQDYYKLSMPGLGACVSRVIEA